MTAKDSSLNNARYRLELFRPTGSRWAKWHTFDNLFDAVKFIERVNARNKKTWAEVRLLDPHDKIIWRGYVYGRP